MLRLGRHDEAPPERLPLGAKLRKRPERMRWRETRGLHLDDPCPPSPLYDLPGRFRPREPSAYYRYRVLEGHYTGLSVFNITRRR